MILRGGWWDGSKSHRWRQCHVPAFAFDFEVAQNSKRNWIRGKNELNFEPLQYFRAKKSEPLRPKDTWSGFRGRNQRKMNCSNFEPLQNQMQMLARDIVSIDDFLSHLTIPPVPYLELFVLLALRTIRTMWTNRLFAVR